MYVSILELMADRKMEALELRSQNSGFLSTLHAHLLGIYFHLHLPVWTAAREAPSWGNFTAK